MVDSVRKDVYQCYYCYFYFSAVAVSQRFYFQDRPECCAKDHCIASSNLIALHRHISIYHHTEY